MEIIEVQDIESAVFLSQNKSGDLKYVFTNKPYLNLEWLSISGDTLSDFPLVEGDELNAPNLQILSISGNIFHQSWTSIMEGEELKQAHSEVYYNPDLPGYNHSILTFNKLNVPKLLQLDFYGEYSYNLFINKPDHFLNAPELETLYFHGTAIPEVPLCLTKPETLKSLTFRSESLTSVPEFIFQCHNLEELHLQHVPGITIIPDKIKNLQNLQVFDLWQSSIKYLSPELFLLPKLKRVSFAYSSYTPTREVLEAAEVFRSKGHVCGWPSGQGSDAVEVLKVYKK